MTTYLYDRLTFRPMVCIIMANIAPQKGECRCFLTAFLCDFVLRQCFVWALLGADFAPKAFCFWPTVRGFSFFKLSKNASSNEYATCQRWLFYSEKHQSRLSDRALVRDAFVGNHDFQSAELSNVTLLKVWRACGDNPQTFGIFR